MRTLVLSAGAVAALDQASKLFVTRHLAAGRPYVPAGAMQLRLTVNPRGGLAPLSRNQAVILWLALAILAAIMVPSLPAQGAVALGLALGGATGNLFDRILRGSVVDFIAIGTWPVFNIADVAMVAGAVLMVLTLL